MANFSIGLTALQTSQYAMDVISSNMANANTPGYHRRAVHLEARNDNVFGNRRIGSGVSINYIERIRNSVTESSLTNSISDTSNVDQLLSVEIQIEALLQPGDGSVNERLDEFFAEITKLTSTPAEPTQQIAVVEAGTRMSDTFHQIATQLFELRSAVRFQIEQEVDSLNGQMETLTELQAQIEIIGATSDPNAELDQRDQLINDIAQVIDVTRHEHFRGGLNLAFGGTSIQQGLTPIEFQTFTGENGQVGIKVDELNRPISIESGRLPALLELYNTTIPAFEQRLNEAAAGLIREFDQVHASGIGSTGSFSLLDGSRPVGSTDLPLNEAGLAFPVEAGELYFSIIDPSGNRRTESITIDPATQSLKDVAARISAIGNLQASIDPQTNRLQIIASPGYEFDFTGSLETAPDQSSLSGTATATLGGSYTGDASRELSFAFEGSGTIGKTDDLFVNVFDESGALLTRLNVGAEYEPGTPIETIDGVTIAFSSGSVVDGESFASTLVENPDETGILSSLGLNSFFVGHDAGTIGISARIADDPRSVASGQTGDVSDTENLFDMISLAKERKMAGGRLSFAEHLNEISTDIGSKVKSNKSLSSNLNALKTRFEQERDSYSGVDLNEELVFLQQYQTSYEAAARVIQTADDMLNELFAILR